MTRPAIGLALAAAVAACSSGGSSSAGSSSAGSSSAGSSSAGSSSGAEGSFSAAPTQVHPTAQSAPAVPPSASASVSASGGASTGGATGAANGTGNGVGGAIAADWKKFFSSSTTSAQRVALLQNGPQFSAAVRALTSSPLGSAVTVTVDSVTQTSATAATVRYRLAAGQSAVSSGTGTAVRQDGTWKVGDDVFCALLSKAKGAGLSVPAPRACGAAG